MSDNDQYVTLDQFRALVQSGAVKDICLEGMGAGFIVVANLKNKARAVLRALHANTVREYRDPRRAFEQLRALGIVEASVRFEKWEPGQKTIA